MADFSLQQMERKMFSDSSENEAEQNADEGKEKSQLIAEDAREKKSAFLCSGELVKMVIIVVVLWIAFFLCYVAISTIAPFFPKEVTNTLLSEITLVASCGPYMS